MKALLRNEIENVHKYHASTHFQQTNQQDEAAKMTREKDCYRMLRYILTT